MSERTLERTGFRRSLCMLVCVAIVVSLFPASSEAAPDNGPDSHDAGGTYQPATGSDYSIRIDGALKTALDQSNLDAIAKKNSYFATDADRTRGIIKTDIVMLGDLPANDVDVLFISDVSGSMCLYAKETHNAPYACSCCTPGHVYCIPANLTFQTGAGTPYTINQGGQDWYFSLADLEIIVGRTLTGIQWENMNWPDIFSKVGLAWPTGLSSPDFLIGWQPDKHHYSNTHTSIPKETQTSTTAYYSPSATFQRQYGCTDRMTIARASVVDISERVLAYSKKSHIGLVDFAGNHCVEQIFTDNLADVERFAENTDGYDFTYYHLGLNAAADMLKDHYQNGTPNCNNPLYVVFISDGRPDYGGAGAPPDPLQALNTSIAKLHGELQALSNSAEIYAAGICVSDNVMFGGKTTSQWLETIATVPGVKGAYKNCHTIPEFQTFTAGILNNAANVLTAVLKDTLGPNFTGFVCDATHPFTVSDYYGGQSTSYYSLSGLPPYVKVDTQARTVTWDISRMSIYKPNLTDLAGLRLDFYCGLRDSIVQAIPSGTAAGKYPTNDGNATLTYIGRDNKTQTITMPPPYVLIRGDGGPAGTEKADVPKTGDSALPALWSTLVVISLAGFVVSHRRYRRKRG